MNKIPRIFLRGIFLWVVVVYFSITIYKDISFFYKKTRHIACSINKEFVKLYPLFKKVVKVKTITENLLTLKLN